ncbi:hypothetical protein FDP08_02295 [Marinobacter panjinensis]|uniref:Trypsin-like peptidase domain-containing protein n=1 Tax=Marinobacter panjinensis TaxID=2576384 RepID=A0A4U6R0M3_9GAMM|nr:hypothetical protein [Marinobacter panjinensis]MCR8916038.1 hypothetical protein [Marinobacter panjinensis]TKV67000.1 hypothetical protein FDP08_02295 [Marinobacter panjinensis]
MMDESEFKKELMRMPLRYTLPISCLSKSGIVSPGSATVTLVQYKDRFFCVTNQHVVTELEKEICGEVYCQIGNTKFNLVKAKKFVDDAGDLCCFEVEREIVNNFTIWGENPRFIQLAENPVIIEPGQYVNFGGYPGCFRSKTKDGYNFDTFSHGGCLVSSVSDSTFSCLMEKEFEEEVRGDRRWEELTALGGISGCPVFAWIHEPVSLMELAGIVQEGELHLFGSETSPIMVSKIDNIWMEKAIKEL